MFLLIGLQFRGIVTDVAGSTLTFSRIALACGAILATVMVLRPLWVFPATYLPRKVHSLRRADPAPSWQNPAVVSWAGMRGVVTLAAAFVLPETVPHREILILVALVVTAGTLLIQGFTLPKLVRMLGLRGPDRREDTLQEAALLQEATKAGLAELEKLTAPDDPEDIVELLRTRTQERSRAGVGAPRPCRDGDSHCRLLSTPAGDASCRESVGIWSSEGRAHPRGCAPQRPRILRRRRIRVGDSDR